MAFRAVTSELVAGLIVFCAEYLDQFFDGRFKASAVMTGCSAESVILRLRDLTVDKLNSLGRTIPRELTDWRVKTVSDGLHDFFDANSAAFSRQVREPFEAYWAAFSQQIRTTRNAAGHPVSVDPVTPDSVHASLLIFPELARLATALSNWVNTDLK